MIVLILIGSLFLGLARKNNLNKFVWLALGIAAYFVGQILGQFVLELTHPMGVYSMTTIYGYTLGGGVIFVIVVWGIMQSVIRKKKAEKNLEDDNLLDNTYLKD